MASVEKSDPQYQIARYNFLRKSGIESYIPHLYLDNRGFLTTGIGFLLARGHETRAQKLSRPILQSPAIDAAGQVVGGLDSIHQSVIQIVEEDKRGRVRLNFQQQRSGLAARSHMD